MAWTTDLDGFSKARLKKIHSKLQDVIEDLQDCFEADTTLSFLTTTYSALTSDNVLRGDYEGMWDIKTGGYLRVYVSAGGHRDGTDLTQQRFYISTGSVPGGKKRTYNTMVTCLFHEKAFPIGNPDIQSRLREDAYATITDWLDFDCFGTDANRKFAIDSNCMDNPGGKDFLYDNIVSSVGKIWTPTGSGGATVLTGISAIIQSFG